MSNAIGIGNVLADAPASFRRHNRRFVLLATVAAAAIGCSSTDVRKQAPLSPRQPGPAVTMAEEASPVPEATKASLEAEAPLANLAAPRAASEPPATAPAARLEGVRARKAAKGWGSDSGGGAQGFTGHSGSLATIGRGAYVPRPQASVPVTEADAEAYAHIVENAFTRVTDHPQSTFSIDVDTASYSNARRFLEGGSLPPKDAIRVEEWVNYFSYDYPEPRGDAPFSIQSEVSVCPWNPDHRLVRLGIKGKTIAADKVPARNLVFLIDVSGSMQPENKLPLLKRGLALLVRTLREQDHVAMVVYAGATGLVLPPTSGADQGRILAALEQLESGGSTNGGDGIRLAYAVAQRHFRKDAINRVILATDGDFNVGTTSHGELTRLIEEKRQSGVFLTVLGFGEGNLKDSTMETLADKGNGNYAYIDSIAEARKVLVHEAGATLVTIAKDVKLQVEFNPARVGSYKLIGYENRLLAKEDFNDDRKDAGEIGAGHTVTALYEIVPAGAPSPALPPPTDPSKYQAPAPLNPAAASDELATVNIRYKPPTSDTSTKFSMVVKNASAPLAKTSDDFRFSAAVANAALLLRGAPDLHQSSLATATRLASGALGKDPAGLRREFITLLARAQSLRGGEGHVIAPR
ncbi:MAG TPA: VWA domain-containing protein [Polyangia bacterium]|nr:VWA domain-containing protein [Polyangia bacterium]